MAWATAAETDRAAFETRQVWVDSLLADRREVQQIIDHQARALADLQGKFQGLLEDRANAQLVIESLKEDAQHVDNLRRDRAKAQLVMDSQQEQLKQWTAQANALVAEVETLRVQLKEQKAILKWAKTACRKKGRCFSNPNRTESATALR